MIDFSVALVWLFVYAGINVQTEKVGGGGTSKVAVFEHFCCPLSGEFDHKFCPMLQRLF